MSQPQAYIFPKEGVTKEGDEYLADDTWKALLHPGWGIDTSCCVRRPVPTPSLQWIAYKDRMPTAEDADQDECVIMTNGETTTYVHWNQQPRKGFTHWHPILKASAMPKRDTEREEFEAWKKTYDFSDTYSENPNTQSDNEMFAAWQAARARKEAP